MHEVPRTLNLHVPLSATGTHCDSPCILTRTTMIPSAYADWGALTVLTDGLQKSTVECLTHLALLLQAGLLLWAALFPCCSEQLASLPKACSRIGCLDLLSLGFTEELHRRAWSMRLASLPGSMQAAACARTG